MTYIGNIPLASDSFFIHFPPFFDFLLQGPCKYYKRVTISIFLELGRIKCVPFFLLITSCYVLKKCSVK